MHPSLYLTEQHHQVRDLVRDFAQQVIRPSARRYDLESRFPWAEPGAGSDAGGTKTTAVDRGDHYVLNGSKIFITHAGVGEIFVVTARTDLSATKTHGITAFIVTKDTCDLEDAQRVGIGHEASLPKCPGVLAAKKEDKLGWRASDTRELVFQDAIVPKESVLGPVNNGFRQFLHTLDGGRI